VLTLNSFAVSCYLNLSCLFSLKMFIIQHSNAFPIFRTASVVYQIFLK
jgi:hypothetical protein